jgi:hypothetical protein
VPAGTGFVDTRTATIKLSYALAEDAVRVCALVSAVPNRSVGDCATLASFNYDRALTTSCALSETRGSERSQPPMSVEKL